MIEQLPPCCDPRGQHPRSAGRQSINVGLGRLLATNAPLAKRSRHEAWPAFRCEIDQVRRGESMAFAPQHVNNDRSTRVTDAHLYREPTPMVANGRRAGGTPRELPGSPSVCDHRCRFPMKVSIRDPSRPVVVHMLWGECHRLAPLYLINFATECRPRLVPRPLR